MKSIVCFGEMGMEPNQNNWWNGSMGRQQQPNQLNQPTNSQIKLNQSNVFDWIDCLIVIGVDGWMGCVVGRPPNSSIIDEFELLLSFASFTSLKSFIFQIQDFHSVLSATSLQ